MFFALNYTGPSRCEACEEPTHPRQLQISVFGYSDLGGETTSSRKVCAACKALERLHPEFTVAERRLNDALDTNVASMTIGTPDGFLEECRLARVERVIAGVGNG